jgi:glucan biosynthesis protein C
MSRTDRLHHMDAVRCFCMLFGLMVHGATLANNWLFDSIQNASAMFRMAAFFLVSGFFAAMVASRQPAHAFLANRARLLLVPLAAGLLLLNPITNWLIHWFHGNPMSLGAWFAGGWRQTVPPPAQPVWHLHLWFLFSLMAYALLTPGLSRLAATRPAARLVDGLLRLPAQLRPLVLGLAVGAATVALRGLHDQLPAAGGPFAFIIGATFGYLPFFAIGLWAFRDRRLYDMLHAFPWVALALLGALHLGHAALAAGLPHGAERALYWLARAGFSFSIVVAMLALARRWVTRGSPLLSALTDGVYSFYIFHFLAIYAIAVAMQAVTSNVYVIFAVVLLVGYPLLFAIHRRLIAPHPWMAFLWNGKTMPVRGARANQG